MKKTLLALMTLALAAPNWAQDLTAVSPEGVEIYFMILDENEMTCATMEEEAIDKSTVGKVTIPDEVEGYAVVGISDYSFEDCEDVTEVVLPHYLQWISERAFWGCGIEQITIGDIDGSYTEVPCELYDQAVSGCPNLTTITLGQNVAFEGSGLFSNAPSLAAVYSYITEPSAIGNVFPFSNEGLTLYVPVGTKELYQNTAGWSNFPNIVEMEVATGIKDVNAAAAVSVRYHNLAGMTSDHPFPGINLVTTTYSDGSSVTTKVIK